MALGAEGKCYRRIPRLTPVSGPEWGDMQRDAFAAVGGLLPVLPRATQDGGLNSIPRWLFDGSSRVAIFAYILRLANTWQTLVEGINICLQCTTLYMTESKAFTMDPRLAANVLKWSRFRFV